jgi:membrane-bound metal-dependent hydrolase YbcI (DUF457 family)
VTIWLMLTKKVNFTTLFIAVVVMIVSFLPTIAYELTSNFSQFHQGLLAMQDKSASGRGVDAVNFWPNALSVLEQFKTLMTKSVIPGITQYGVASALISVSLLALILRSRDSFKKRFALSTLSLWFISLGWFFTNTGFRDWQVSPLAPLLLVSILLLLMDFKKVGGVVISLLLIVNLLAVVNRVQALDSDKSDESMLSNQLETIDWIYSKADDNCFSVYTYIPSVYDYQYQYLYWWYGNKQYGYAPCLYGADFLGNFSYVPSAQKFKETNKKATDQLYLVIEPAKEKFLQDEWYKTVTEGTRLIESNSIGQIGIEKREAL